MNRQLIVIAFMLAFAMTACAPDPRKEAQAYAIQSTADQTALNAQQAREQSEELHNIEIQNLQYESDHRKAIAARWDAAVNTIIKAFGIFGSIAVSASLIALAISFSRASIGISQAMSRAAMVRANLIYLNPTTRQFPLFVQHIHGSRYALHNPNTGSVLMLDERNPADRQMISTAGATQVAGVIAQEARQSSDPAGISIMRPPVIDAKDRDLIVGASFLENAISFMTGDEDVHQSN